MGVDLRQVVAGVLTLTMFVMLGNMIKRDHFDNSLQVSTPSFSLGTCSFAFARSHQKNTITKFILIMKTKAFFPLSL